MDIVVPDKLRLLKGTVEVAVIDVSESDHGATLGGRIVCRDTSGNYGIVLDGGVEGMSGGPDGGSIMLRNGSVILNDRDGKQRTLLLTGDEIEGLEGGLLVLKVKDDPSAGATGEVGAITLNAAKRALVIRSKSGIPRVELGEGGDLRLGGGDTNGAVYILNTDGGQLGKLGGENPNLSLGGYGHDGDVLLADKDGDTRIHLDAGSNSANANANARVHISGSTATVTLGGNEKNGDVQLLDTAGNKRVSITASTPKITLMNASGETKVKIDGEAGDIVLPNADCAEDFDLVAFETCEPGSVMVIDLLGKLRESSDAYDKKVAGVLSGAGEYKPGIVLDRKSDGNEGRMPLALIGKVHCKVDAQYGAIEVGDLLTTSPTPGHAMKASDPARAFGCVIGKALRPLAEGQGMIPILVALQ